jgi:hypothetical protein
MSNARVLLAFMEEPTFPPRTAFFRNSWETSRFPMPLPVREQEVGP